jgi:pantoate--beta-alanine ligase
VPDTLSRRHWDSSRPWVFSTPAILVWCEWLASKIPASRSVVARLFNLFQPQRAYFGQKDGQQCVVVKKLTTELGFPIDIVVVPTVREPDGLALSSRNVYLTPVERVAARVLSASLRSARVAFQKGERSGEELRRLIQSQIEREPLAKLDYVSVADAMTLEEVDRIEGPVMVSLAVRIGRARLIDNEILG